ncbi:hypothetical protein FGF1_34920 [Flavobacteriaceae bacterium GF1]
MSKQCISSVNLNNNELHYGDLFAFGINYNTVGHSGTALYNGNIAETEWRTANTDSGLKWYRYAYDPLNRITSAAANSSNYSLSGITYDKNGNIQSLTRRGHTDAGATSFGTMDVLDYDYHNSEMSNRLYKVNDTGSNTYGFKDSSANNQDYWYDANGNMVRDLNKGIGTASLDGITYNHLNLPQEIKFDNNNNKKINYIYDALGTKIQKVANDNGSLTTTDYAGNFVYENGTLQFFSHPEGYVNANGGGYDHVYQYKDHLGNVRLSYTDNPSNPGTPTIIEENNYYPFGLEHKGYNNQINGVENNYMTYSGKELDESLGLNWLDFGFRNYDASIGRWMSIDPLAEKYYDKSGYNYAFNNPVFFVDPDGQEVDVTELLRKNGKNELFLLINLMANLSEISGQKISVNTDNDGKSILTSEGCGDSGNCSDSGSAFVDHLLGSEDVIKVNSTSNGTATTRQGGVDYVLLDAEQIYGQQKALEDNGVDSRTNNVGMVFLHESLHTVTGAKFFDSEEDNREKTGRVFRDPNDNDAATQTGPVTDRINAIRSELNLPTRYIYGSTPSTLYYEVDGTKKQIRYTKQSIPDLYKNKKVKQ